MTEICSIVGRISTKKNILSWASASRWHSVELPLQYDEQPPQTPPATCFCFSPSELLKIHPENEHRTQKMQVLEDDLPFHLRWFLASSDLPQVYLVFLHENPDTSVFLKKVLQFVKGGNLVIFTLTLRTALGHWIVESLRSVPRPTHRMLAEITKWRFISN